MPSDHNMAEFVTSLKKVAAVLRDEGIPFALGGGLAAWARGGPETDHDVDFFLKPEDAERAQQALAAAGLRPDRPPEDWLHKVWDGDVLVDLVFCPSGGPVTDEWLDRAEEREVMAMRLPVLSLEDLMVTKLLALREQEPDYAAVLKIARTLREQVDWDEVRERTAESAFARAFFTLVEGLDIVAPAGRALTAPDTPAATAA
jgi:predicted nucleotidyltransferase